MPDRYFARIALGARITPCLTGADKNLRRRRGVSLSVLHVPNNWKQWMFHWRGFWQLCRKPWEFRRGSPLSRRMPDIVANEPHRKSPATMRTRDAARCMQRQHVETHHVAGLECPAAYIECLTIGIDVRQVRETPFREPLR